MKASRRKFLKQLGGLGGLAVCGKASTVCAGRRAEGEGQPGASRYGVLVDTTRCVGCRRCEKACNEINTELPRKDAEFFQDPHHLNAKGITLFSRVLAERVMEKLSPPAAPGF